MKILLITSMFPPYCGGGVSTHVRDLAASLGTMGHDVWVLSSRRGQPVDRQESASIPPSTRAIFCRNFRQMFTRIGPLVRRGGFDVLHYHAFNALALAPLSVGGPGASIFTLHSDSANYIASVRGWTSRAHPAYKVLRLYERLAAGFPDMTIAVSNRMQDYARSIGIRHVIRIPNAVDCDYWHPGPARSRAEARALLVPRMHVPKNGIAYALEAMRAIVEAVPDATMLVTGDGPLRASLERQGSGVDGDRIRFLGMVGRDEMMRLYQESAAVVIPSITSSGTQENTSIAALEAMACGTPVIATDTGGLPEVIRDGRDGFLVPEKDPLALAQAAIRLLQDEGLAQRMATECRDHVVREFSVSNWASRVLETYRRALDVRRSEMRPPAG